MKRDSSRMLAQAVHQSRWWTWQGLTERLFTAWFGGFVYNQIWEDPRVDLEALQLTPDSRLLTIASGGCNILNYLVHGEGPASITAVDLNCHHMYLTRLKIEAARRLPSHDDFFRFFGHADDPINIVNYRHYLCGHLDEQTRRFWEGRRGWRFFRGPRIGYFSKNFYNHTKFGQLMRFTHAVAKLTKRNPALMLAAQSLEEQQRVFEQTFGPFFDHWFVRLTGRVPLVCYSLGIPPRQYRALRGDSASIVDVYRERVQRLACQFPVQDNYFTWQAFGRSYDTASKQALPEYLRAEHWNVLQQRMGRVGTHITSATAHLQAQPDNSMDRFVFLDAQDWMKGPEIAALWGEVARVGKPASRIIFRTAAADSPVETALPARLRQRFTYHREASASLHQRDRSAIYGGFHLYTLDN